MKVTIYADGQLKEASIEELGAYYEQAAWISVVDPSLNELGRIVEVLGLPEYSLIGNLRSNYPHVDTSTKYTKFFSWFILPSKRNVESSYLKCPIVVFSNGVSVISLSQLRTEFHERVINDLNAPILSSLSLVSRIIYIFMTYNLENFERYTEEFEQYTDKLEGIALPWSKEFYLEASRIRREVSRLLRIIKHFRIMTDSLSNKTLRIPLSDEDAQFMDLIYDKAVGIEETTETLLETIRDLISLNLETVSHDMNIAMRLMASITVIIAIPSVIGSLFGMNLIDNPWPLMLWQVFLVCLSVALFFSVYFYFKGWIRSR